MLRPGQPQKPPAPDSTATSQPPLAPHEGRRRRPSRFDAAPRRRFLARARRHPPRPDRGTPDHAARWKKADHDRAARAHSILRARRLLAFPPVRPSARPPVRQASWPASAGTGGYPPPPRLMQGFGALATPSSLDRPSAFAPLTVLSILAHARPGPVLPRSSSRLSAEGNYAFTTILQPGASGQDKKALRSDDRCYTRCWAGGRPAN
ncbi:hypothetical protein CDD83_8204 [Cordyceps sp. RAO-2017]|nr:hypothetical protein CDD83_8204 [Cordyceps sp. RAO-2017]